VNRLFPPGISVPAAAFFDVPIAVDVAVAGAPFERRVGCARELAGQGVVVRPVLGLGERAEKQGGSVDGRVEDARPEPALDRLTVANLVQDPARLLLAARVDSR